MNSFPRLMLGLYIHTRKRAEISRILYTHTPKVPLACHLITFNSAWGLKYEKMPWFQVHFIRWDPNVSIEIHLKKSEEKMNEEFLFAPPSLCIHVNSFKKFVQNLTPNHSPVNPTSSLSPPPYPNGMAFKWMNLLWEVECHPGAKHHKPSHFAYMMAEQQQQQQQQRRGPTGIFSIVNLLFIGIFSSLEFSSQV